VPGYEFHPLVIPGARRSDASDLDDRALADRLRSLHRHLDAHQVTGRPWDSAPVNSVSPTVTWTGTCAHHQRCAHA
jgi:hypothetical protein